jgi:hypothetical protein
MLKKRESKAAVQGAPIKPSYTASSLLVLPLFFSPLHSQRLPDQTKQIAAARPILHHVRHPRCFRLRRQFSSETFPCHWIISPVNQIKSNQISHSKMKTKKIEFLFFLFSRLKHRGPDWSGLHCHGDCYLAHQRLAIVDPASGDQPLYNQDKTVVVTVCCLFSSLSLSLYFFHAHFICGFLVKFRFHSCI